MSKSDKIIDIAAEAAENFGGGVSWGIGIAMVMSLVIWVSSPDANAGVEYSNKLTASNTVQNAEQRTALLEANKTCTAQLTGTINKGQTVTVTRTSYEPGFIMERYYIEEQGGRWYYANSLSGIECS